MPIEQVQNLTPEQQTVFDNFVSMLSPEQQQQMMETAQSGFDKARGVYEQYTDIDEQATRDRFTRTTAEPAYRDFREQVIPEIQERIAASGSGGGPTEHTALATAGTRLQEDLDRQFEDVYSSAQDKQIQAANYLAGLSSEQLNQLLAQVKTTTGTKTFENINVEREPSVFERFAVDAGKTYFGIK